MGPCGLFWFMILSISICYFCSKVGGEYNSPLPDTAEELEGKFKEVTYGSSPKDRRSLTEFGKSFGGEPLKRSMF